MAYEIPDFTSLANQQAGLNSSAANAQTLANRANQTGPNGEQLTWTQGPGGQWTQTTTLGAGQQGVNNALQTNQQARLGASTADYQNLGDWGSTDLRAGVTDMPDAGFGASQQVIDAWKALQQPGLDQSRDAERTRLAAMGITLGSDASNTSERNLSNAQTDADNKAILAGTTEYGNVFNRGMQSRQQGVSENLQQSNLINALRGQKVSEANSLASGVSAYDPKFASYAGATTAPAADIYGAARDNWSAANTQYQNALGQQNANAASSATTRSGNLGLLGMGISALGGAKGISGMAGGIADWFGGGSNGFFSAGNNSNWGGNWTPGEDFLAKARA